MEQTTTKKKRPLKLMITGLLVFAALASGYYYWQKSLEYETTDNAQIDGDIAPIRAGISAYVELIGFKDNQRVKKDDTLIIFNTNELVAKLRQAEAALQNAKASYTVYGSKAMASAENADASAQTADASKQDIAYSALNVQRAGQDLDRINELLKIKAATQEQYETANSRWLLAKTEYQKAIIQQQASAKTSHGLQTSAKAELGQISVAQATIKQREAELALAREQLSHAYIIAPFDGIVSKRNVQEGQYVSAGQSLCSIISNTHLWISANVKETQLDKIKIGQPAEIKVDAFPGVKIIGRVESFNGATGTKFSLIPADNATGNFIKITQRFPLRISIDNFFMDKNIPTVLYPGLSAFVKIKTN